MEHMTYSSDYPLFSLSHMLLFHDFKNCCSAPQPLGLVSYCSVWILEQIKMLHVGDAPLC